jgi:glycosyltransferase involved in cell wall biosynthesis
MHTLAICTLMANERPYVEEWVAFHRLQGVTLFRVYVDRTRDDLPDDGTAEVLHALGAEVVDWTEPGPRRQVGAFNAGLASLKGRAEWVAFIDCDEFLFHPDMALVDWLAGIPAPAIGVQQTVFGSMGRITKPAGLVTESYTLRATRSYAEHRWFKSVVRPECAVEFHNSHMARIPHGYVLGDNEPFTVNHPGCADRIATTGPRLHHYMLKSREEWMAKKARGALSDGAAPGFKRFTDEYTARDAHCNLVPDDTAARVMERATEWACSGNEWLCGLHVAA